jgi:hypothetical protein
MADVSADNLDWTALSMQLTNGQLAFLVGAGLSMTGKSPLPSADSLLQLCVQRIEQAFGETPPEEARASLEALCDYLHGMNQLGRLFIHSVVPWAQFKNGEPNDGHLALADFLITRATGAVVSTNYDTRIETAARDLGELDFVALTSADELEPRNHSRLLKIHGCALRDEATTLWCPAQVDDPPIKQRLEASVKLVPGWLANKDIVILGFWSDWPHMYDTLCHLLAGADPACVYIVNPSPQAELPEKAPALWAWAEKHHLIHVQMEAEKFLHEMWTRYGVSLLRRAFSLCSVTYEHAFHLAPPPMDAYTDWPSNPMDLFGLRADLLGSPRGKPVRDRDLDNDSSLLAAAVLRRLIDRGAALDGDALLMNEQRIRVIGHGGLMSTIKAAYESEPLAHQDATTMVCPAAVDDGGAPIDVVRENVPGDIVRGGVTGTWLSLREAEALISQ